jgi:rhamnulokinase
VDYAYLDANGQLLALPVHYRDERTAPYQTPDISPRDIYARTGIQYMPINTLYQLRADAAERPHIIKAARHFLMISDLFVFFLTGKKINEYTMASTSQLLNARTKAWDTELAGQLYPEAFTPLLLPVTMPGTVIGALRGDVLAETGLDGSSRMVAVGSHDTASAVAGTPLAGGNAAYLSCGTWSLMGAELDEPCLSPESFAANFTNEGGLEGKIRYLKNINGLYIIQQLLKSHNRTAAEKLDYPGLSQAAENADKTGKNRFIINPQEPLFNNPADMAKAVAGYCVNAGQDTPEGIGELAAAVYNGLVKEYAAVLNNLSGLLNKPIETLHMVGGGIKDVYLCRRTAEAVGRRVEAGPVEASALGNIIAQMMGLGEIESLSQGREIIRRSFKPVIYEP